MGIALKILRMLRGRVARSLVFREEATALVLMHQLLASLDKGGLIGPHIEPIIGHHR